MKRFFLFFLCITPLYGNDFAQLKQEIHTLEQRLKTCADAEERALTYYSLAQNYTRDQELEKAFQSFLCALNTLPLREEPPMAPEESLIYKDALAHYLENAGSDPIKLAEHMIETYASVAASHPDYLHLNFLIATNYANLGMYDLFFERFFRAYPQLHNTFLAYKTRGILYLRLAQACPTPEDKLRYQKEATRLLSAALDTNPQDGSLYKVLVFLAKEGNDEPRVHALLENLVAHRARIARGDIYLYVREAVRLEDHRLAQKIIDRARSLYEYSRAITASQDYLNQNRG